MSDLLMKTKVGVVGGKRYGVMLNNKEISSMIAYAMNVLRRTNIYARTYVQKIVYFLIPDEYRKELFEPIRTGPYSPGVQRIIQYLEENPHKISIWSSELEPELKRKIDFFVEFIIFNSIDTYTFSLLVKVHYLKSKGLSYERGADILGWKDVLIYGPNIEWLLEEVVGVMETGMR